MGAINQLTLEHDGVVVSGSGIQPGRQDADAFIAKYSLSGEPLWSTWVSSDGTDSATGLFIQDNAIWVVGFTDGALFLDATTVSLSMVGLVVLIARGVCLRENRLMRMRTKVLRAFVL